MDAEKMLIEIGIAQRSSRTRPWFRGFAPFEDTDQEDYLHDDD
jgi:hypothetical protein